MNTLQFEYKDFETINQFKKKRAKMFCRNEND